MKLRVFGIGGALVRTLADQPFAAGEHRVVWDGTDDRGHAVASGTYFMRLDAEGSPAESRKVILLR